MLYKLLDLDKYAALGRDVRPREGLVSTLELDKNLQVNTALSIRKLACSHEQV
jgi:hypothetical protein